MKHFLSSAVDQRQIEALLESDEFDPFWYDEAYPDVRLSGLGPVEHYLMIGKRLGRAGTAEGDAKDVTRPLTSKLTLKSTGSPTHAKYFE